MKVARIGRGAHAEEAYALAAEGRLHIREHRGRDERDILPLALDDEGQGLARMGAYDLLQLGEARIACPSTLSTRSPGRKPATAAALEGSMRSMRGVSVCLP